MSRIEHKPAYLQVGDSINIAMPPFNFIERWYIRELSDGEALLRHDDVERRARLDAMQTPCKVEFLP